MANMTYARSDAHKQGSFSYIPSQVTQPRSSRSALDYVLTATTLASTGMLATALLQLPAKRASTPYLDLGISTTTGVTWRQLVQGNLQWRDILLEYIKRAEELSPFYLGRTFGLSEILSPYILGTRPHLHIPYEVVKEQLPYLETLINRPSLQLKEEMWARGMVLREGKLFGITASDEYIELLPYARLRLSHWHPPEIGGLRHPPMRGRMSAATQEILARGRGLSRTTLIPFQHRYAFHIVGSARQGKIPVYHFMREIQSIAEMWNRRFFRLLDNPLELLADIGVQFEGIPVLQRIGHALSSTGLTYRFGLAGDYSGNILQQWGRWLLPGFARRGPHLGRFRPGALLTFIGVPFAYRAIDQYLRDHSEQLAGTSLQWGLSGAIANAWQRLNLWRASFGNLTGLSALARKQEEIAPGTTHPGTMLGVPLATGIASGLAGFIHSRFAGRESILEMWRSIKLPQHQFSGILSRIFPGRYTLTGKYIRAGIAAGAILELPFLPGAIARALGGLRTREELEAIYSGEEEVPVKKGRWWEFGSSHFSGEKTLYYRPHWTVLAKRDPLNQSLFRGDESWLFKAAKRTPILTDIVSPYYLEQLHYYDRPYPITGPSIPPLGPIGPLYALTLGRLFKPPRYMHREEWQVPGGYKYQREEHAPIPELGGLPPAPPESPYSVKRLSAEAWHRWTEAIGLPGWLVRLATGSEEWGAQGLQFASAERLVSEERTYWDKNLGGLMGLTEWYRRINVRRRTPIGQQEYAPIPNRMPSWMPGESYFINFHEGDIAKIPEAEIRLPGPGYAALYPEVRGLHPEEYPHIHRFRILANVAPWAEETAREQQLLAQLQKEKQLSDREERQYKRILAQWRDVKQRRHFVSLKDWSERPFWERPLGRYWEMLAHGSERLHAGESLLPLRPLGKFIHQREAIEDYLYSQVLGADKSFWNRPVADFIRPAIDRAISLAKPDHIPPHTQQRRLIEEYFDKLAYIRARYHAARAARLGDMEAAASWYEAASTTLAGLEPTLDREGITRAMRALPNRERDYFSAFLKEEDPSRQERILSLVPPQVGRIYRLFWEQQAIRRLGEERAEATTTTVKQEIDRLRSALAADVLTGGRLTEDRLEEYRREQPDIPLHEWLREKEIEEFFGESGLPSPESIIWDPRVDLEDVKLKVVQSLGLDFHDFNLWDARARSLLRKPYLENVEEELYEITDEEEIRRQLQNMLRGYGVEAPTLNIAPLTGQNRIVITYDDTPMLVDQLTRDGHGKRRPFHDRKSKTS